MPSANWPRSELRFTRKRQFSQSALSRARVLEHPLRDVDARGVLEVTRERTCQSPNAAAEVERTRDAALPAELPRHSQHGLDIRLPALEEAIELPALVAGLRLGEDRPERIDEREIVPVALLPPEPHVATHHA